MGGGVGNKTTCACVEAGKGRGAMGKGEEGGVRNRVLVGFVLRHLRQHASQEGW